MRASVETKRPRDGDIQGASARLKVTSCERIDRIVESLQPSGISSLQENVGRARADWRKLQLNQHRNQIA